MVLPAAADRNWRFPPNDVGLTANTNNLTMVEF
jgi:hypothetical protein